MPRGTFEASWPFYGFRMIENRQLTVSDLVLDTFKLMYSVLAQSLKPNCCRGKFHVDLLLGVRVSLNSKLLQPDQKWFHVVHLLVHVLDAQLSRMLCLVTDVADRLLDAVDHGLNRLIIESFVE